MATIKINIPNDFEVSHFDIEMYLASKWYEDGRLTSGQAAKMVGLSKRAFVELLGKYNVSVFGYDYKDLEIDLKNA